VKRSVQSLDGNFGVEIQGIDLSSECSDETLSFLCENLYKHQVVVIRDQRLSRDQYLSFGRRWGTPIPHVLDHMRMDGYPEMMTVGNTEKRDLKNNIRNGAALWHTDQSYEKSPASATMLYSLKVPAHGGETQFCNMTLAFQQMDDARKQQLEPLIVQHKYGYGTRRADELSVNPLKNSDQDQRVPPVLHPLVMQHPVVNQKTLYAVGHGAYGIESMDETAATSLIASLKDYVLQEQFIYRHPYEKGDLVIWDTLQTMHCATPIDAPKSSQDERLLWRISVRGRPEIYR